MGKSIEIGSVLVTAMEGWAWLLVGTASLLGVRVLSGLPVGPRWGSVSGAVGRPSSWEATAGTGTDRLPAGRGFAFPKNGTSSAHCCLSLPLGGKWQTGPAAPPSETTQSGHFPQAQFRQKYAGRPASLLWSRSPFASWVSGSQLTKACHRHESWVHFFLFYLEHDLFCSFPLPSALLCHLATTFHRGSPPWFLLCLQLALNPQQIAARGKFSVLCSREQKAHPAGASETSTGEEAAPRLWPLSLSGWSESSWQEARCAFLR